MTHARHSPLPDAAALAAFAARLRVWLLWALAWLLRVTGVEHRLPPSVRREINAEIAEARIEVLSLIFDLMRLRLRAQRRTRTRTTHADPHRSRIAVWRALTRGVLPPARGLKNRIGVLIAALDDLDAYADRMLAHLFSGAKGAWTVSANDEALQHSLLHAPALRDSS